MFKIEINGKEYSGFKDGSISLSIENLANSFSCTLTNFYDEQVADIQAGQYVRVFDDSTLLLTGYIDEANLSISSDQGNQISISGRSKACDLVDCSVDLPSNEFINLKVEALLNLVSDNFDIPIAAKVETGEPIPKATYELGSKIYEFIRPHLEAKELLAYSEPDGSVVINRSGTDQGTLELIEGENIISGSSSVNLSERYTKYIVKGGQQSSPFLTPEDAAKPDIPATDGGGFDVFRFRPLVIILDGGGDADKCKRRGVWEATVRRGQSSSYSITTNQWNFDLNKKVSLNAPSLGINSSTLIVSQIELSFSDEGRQGTYTLVDPQSFALQPDKEISESESKNSFLK